MEQGKIPENQNLFLPVTKSTFIACLRESEYVLQSSGAKSRISYCTSAIYVNGLLPVKWRRKSSRTTNDKLHWGYTQPCFIEIHNGNSLHVIIDQLLISHCSYSTTIKWDFYAWINLLLLPLYLTLYLLLLTHKDPVWFLW